jgi:hypothetical protein
MRPKRTFLQDGTRSVQLLRQGIREQDNGVQLYEFEYQLDSTRGLKRILNAVTITNSRLFIANAQHKCDRSACTEADEDHVQNLKNVVSSFYVTL